MDPSVLPEDNWYLYWDKSGNILLTHSQKSPKQSLSCPKCDAPMLFYSDGFCCYACGMTFHMKDGLAITRFGKHNWKTRDCGVFLEYSTDMRKSKVEDLTPSQVKETISEG